MARPVALAIRRAAGTTRRGKVDVAARDESEACLRRRRRRRRRAGACVVAQALRHLHRL